MKEPGFARFRRYSAFEAFVRRLRRPNADVGFVLKRSFWELRSPTNQYVCFTESRSKLTTPLHRILEMSCNFENLQKFGSFL